MRTVARVRYTIQTIQNFQLFLVCGSLRLRLTGIVKYCNYPRIYNSIDVEYCNSFSIYDNKKYLVGQFV